VQVFSEPESEHHSRDRWLSERGSAPAEFVMVGVLVVALILGVVQLALFLHVRNTLQDAASEGARWAAMADSTPERGVARTQELIATALGDNYARDVSASHSTWFGHPVVAITVTATVPVLGFLGVPRALIATGHSAIETLRS
jgi:Flp pilus assembly protein TadG